MILKVGLTGLGKTNAFSRLSIGADPPEPKETPIYDFKEILEDIASKQRMRELTRLLSECDFSKPFKLPE